MKRPPRIRPAAVRSRRASTKEGWQGWDEYSPFYDWENARTLGRRDVPFWKLVSKRAGGRVLELGCGTGRILLPLARAGVDIVGVDRSAGMLAHAMRTLRKTKSRFAAAPAMIRGDIRALPFRDREFSVVLAPYGILQSLLRDRDLTATLQSVRRVLAPNGVFGIDLVPDVPNWREYKQKVQMRGRAPNGAHLTLIESVRQDPRRHLTVFEQCYVEKRGRSATRHTFDLTFRTLPMMKMLSRLEGAGFEVESMLGDYRGGPWDERADAWIVLARRD